MDSPHGNTSDAGIHGRKLGARPRIALKRAAFVQSSRAFSGRDLMCFVLVDSFRRLPMGFAARGVCMTDGAGRVACPLTRSPTVLPRGRRPKGRRPLVRARRSASHGAVDARRITAEGNDRGRVAPGARSTALRLRVRVVSRCPATCGGGPRRCRLRLTSPAERRRDRLPSPMSLAAHLAHCSERVTPSRVAVPVAHGRRPRWAFPLDRVPSPAGARRPRRETVDGRTLAALTCWLPKPKAYAYLLPLFPSGIRSPLARPAAARPVRPAPLPLHQVQAADRPAQAGQPRHRSNALSTAPLSATAGRMGGACATPTPASIRRPRTDVLNRVWWTPGSWASDAAGPPGKATAMSLALADICLRAPRPL